MQTELAQTIFEKVKTLSLELQKEILRVVEEKLSGVQAKDNRPIWEVMTEISREIPDEEWAKLPADGSVNHDHYLYGAPKKY